MIDNVNAVQWRKSSYSGGQGGQCVEVAGFSSSIAVRDSKNPTLPTLAFRHTAFSRFTQEIRTGRRLRV